MSQSYLIIKFRLFKIKNFKLFLVLLKLKDLTLIIREFIFILKNI